MIFSGKRIDEISAENIKGLLEAGVPEGKEVDYKQNLPANDNEGKKEFLADVSSFANTTGGDLIFGIREENLIPVEICGLPNLNPDIDIQRLENMIRDGIDPQLPNRRQYARPRRIIPRLHRSHFNSNHWHVSRFRSRYHVYENRELYR